MPVPAVGCSEFALGCGESGLHSAGTGMPVPYGVLTALPVRNWLRQFGRIISAPTAAPAMVVAAFILWSYSVSSFFSMICMVDPIYDFHLVSKKPDSYDSDIGEGLHRVWDHALSILC